MTSQNYSIWKQETPQRNGYIAQHAAAYQNPFSSQIKDCLYAGLYQVLKSLNFNIYDLLTIIIIEVLLNDDWRQTFQKPSAGKKKAMIGFL